MDIVTNDFLFIFEELQGKAGRRLTEMIGKRYTRTQLVCDSRQNRTLYVPLPWWYCQHSGNALSLASLQFHGVALHCDLSPRALHRHVRPQCRGEARAQRVQSSAHGPQGADHHLIRLPRTRRERTFRREPLRGPRDSAPDVLHPGHVLAASNPAQLQPSCARTVRRDPSPVPQQVNNHFCFSGIDNRDPLITADLLVNNQSRFGKKSGLFYQSGRAVRNAHGIPDTFIYVMSFRFHGGSHGPVRIDQHERIDHCDLVLELQEDLSRESCTIMMLRSTTTSSIQGGSAVSRTLRRCTACAACPSPLSLSLPSSCCFCIRVFISFCRCVSFVSIFTQRSVRCHSTSVACAIVLFFLLPCSHGISFFLHAAHDVRHRHLVRVAPARERG